MSDYGLLDGRYRLINELGSGAFGSVHRAAQVVLGKDVREVAVKLFHGDLVTPQNLLEKMNDAFQLLAILAVSGEWQIRQHFLTVFDLGVSRESPPRAFIVMELVQGGNLAKRIRDQVRFTPAGCLHYLRQMVRAVAFMHEHRMVHSDLKPENILLFHGADQDLVKIGDFGLAGTYEGPLQAGPRGGTLAYLAPELFHDISTPPAADVFSLGLIAYEMLTGANPFSSVGSTLAPDQKDYRAALQEMHVQARKTPLSLRRSDFVEASSSDVAAASLATLIDVINRMLQPHPAQRYRNAQAVLLDLDRIAAGGFAIASASGGEDSGRMPRDKASLDPLTIRLQQFDHALATGEWPDAEGVVRAIRESVNQGTGEIDLPFRLKARLELAKAAAIPGYAKNCLLTAAKELERGLGCCPDSESQSRLREQLAGVRKELKLG